MQSGQILELRCFYDQSEKRFHSVVVLGKDVCGFPQTVHGGLTAAIIDETLGGLGLGLWRAGVLGFRPPAYTARLEVSPKMIDCISMKYTLQYFIDGDVTLTSRWTSVPWTSLDVTSCTI